MNDKPFEIGLVMAGAVSAGAYTAGVIDFLLQALTEWERFRTRNPDDTPPHRIKIKVITGASAGGMTAAMLAALLNNRFESISCLPDRLPDEAEIQQNKLYNAWVEQIDIGKLLGSGDLSSPTDNVASLLDSTVLDHIAEEAIRFDNPQQRPAFIDDALHLYLTLTNLQGVPYDIYFQGQSGRGHTISQHTDFFHFLMSSDPPRSNETVWLNPADDTSPGWNTLKKVALATGAFPGGLAPRLIQRPFSHYNLRTWPVPYRPDSDTPVSVQKCVEMKIIKPNWPEHSTGQFNYLAVDGGVMDNEPVELARRQLAGLRGFNPRGARHVQRSVIMVDPFPGEYHYQLKKRAELANPGILGVFGQLFDSLIAQSRFKPDELMLANSDEVYSRFLIAPTRYKTHGTKAEHPIASGFLSGFGGFLSKRFRVHDFQLGRRNCQQFLRRYFALPVDHARQNPVFSSYGKQDFERFSFEHKGQRSLPIIPLLGEAQKEAVPVRWKTLPMTDRELTHLRDQIYGRTSVVVPQLIDQYIEGGITRCIAKIIGRFKRNDIVDKILHIIEEDLDEFNLKI